MKHTGTVTLETNRLILRRFKDGDGPAMYNNWASDDDVTKYLTWPAHENVEGTIALVKNWASHYTEDDYYQWAITLKSNGDQPIGSIAVVRKDDSIKMVHIGYCIGKKWWNQGVMSEALQALITYFFDVVGVNRIEARHDAQNPASGKVMLKCGMQYEGTMRQADWNNQGLCDAAMYAILRNDCRPKSAPNA